MKLTRHIKVYSHGHSLHRIPEIRLEGDWLKRIGFNPSDPLEVTCQVGEITIRNIANN